MPLDLRTVYIIRLRDAVWVFDNYDAASRAAYILLDRGETNFLIESFDRYDSFEDWLQDYCFYEGIDYEEACVAYSR